MFFARINLQLWQGQHADLQLSVEQIEGGRQIREERVGLFVGRHSRGILIALNIYESGIPR